MTVGEKIGLVLVMAFYTSEFPASWRGLEVIIFLVGLTFFCFGRQIEEMIDTFREVQ